MSKEHNFQHDPLDPYQSYVVSASAGTGKTYQLSQRYLRLVAAGADPADILTVTFTRKAAAEMQERIFADAISVLASSDVAEAIDREMQAFFSAAQNTFSHLRPPRPAREAAEAILNFSQSLKIQTIDSLFQELVQKFPIEAGAHIPIPFNIIDKIEQNELHEQAYLRLFEIAEEQSAHGPRLRELLEAYLTYAETSVTTLKDQLAYLQSERLFLFELQRRHNLTEHDLLFPSKSDMAGEPEEELVEMAADILRSAADRIGKKTGANILQTVERFQNSADPKDLRSGVFLRESWELTKKLSENCEPHESEAVLQICYELQRRRLNEHARTIFALFQHYRQELSRLKFEARRVSFDDLSEGVYNLFHSEHNEGVRYFLFMRMTHLLVDEFQDTSRIQWDIFHAIAEELLSGEGLSAEKGLQPTVFLVGDAKQSIYAFRQGDYRLLAEAAEALGHRFGANHMTMEKSWRSGQLVLDQVNKLFSAPEYQMYLEDFQPHATATPGGEPVVPPYGSFTLLAPAEGQSAEEKRENEAGKIIALIAHWLQNGKAIYDKNTKAYRQLRYSDIGVLYRRTVQSEMLEKLLIRNGIPYIKEEKRGYYKRREVEDVIAFLSFLAMPNDNIALATVLRSPILRMSDPAFMELLAAMQREGGQRPALLQLLEDRQSEIYKLLQYCRERLGVWSIDRILLHFLERTRAFAGYELSWGEDEGRLAKANLSQLIEILGTIQPQASGSILEYRDQLKQFRGVDETGNAQLQANSITLMTMHKAKGLEFPVIFLVGAEQGIAGNTGNFSDNGFKKSLHNRNWPFVYIGAKKNERLPEIAEFRLFTREAELEEKKEGMRLLYVAITRAQQHFLATASELGGADSMYTILQTGIFGDAEQHRDEIIPDLEGQIVASENPAQRAKRVREEKTAYGEGALYIPDLEKAMPASGRRTVRPNANPFDTQKPGGDAQQQQVVATAGIDSLAEVERRYLIDRLVHRGLREKILEREWQLADELERAIKNSIYPFSEPELKEIEQTVSAHIDNTRQSPALQKMLAGATRIDAQRTILFRHEQTLIEGELDLLVHKSDGLVLIEWKTDALAEAEPDRLIERNGYLEELARSTEVVRTLYKAQQVSKIIVFTEAGLLIEL